MNEEEIKVKYVLPWLTAAGADLQELQLERTFSVRVGKAVYEIGEKKVVAGARLDILVRRNNKNLFVVETKSGDLTLTDEDRDQAISYARLVHPIAPYAVVTNGRDYRLYDTITKQLVAPSSIRIDGYVAALPDEDLAEAQSFFLALNPANLATFCERQVTSQVNLIKGPVGSGKKYIPELLVAREKALVAFDDFLNEGLPGFILVGESGVGKTNELCSLVEKLLRARKPVLFFNGYALGQNILDAIAQEFSWSFNATENPIQTIGRLERCSGKSKLVVVVDAIDEWPMPNRIQSLARLLQAAENRNLKIIVSCKTSALEPFLTQRDNLTATGFLAQRFDLPPFSGREFNEAVVRHRQAYGFAGGFESDFLKQARSNPFMLRVAFEVASNSQLTHFTFDSLKFFSAYHDRSLKRTSDAQRADRTLREVARLLYERDTDAVPEQEVRKAMGFSVNDQLMEELFEFSLLVRSHGADGEPAISFYFQQFRDYVIGFKTRRFNEVDRATLLCELNGADALGVRVSALVLFYRLASLEKKLQFDEEVREKAKQYLRCYVRLVQENFPYLIDSFAPYTTGSIGLVGDILFPHLTLGALGFRKLEEGEEEIHLIPCQSLINDSNLSDLAGASEKTFVDSWHGFQGGVDIAQEIKMHDIMPQLKRLVAEGRLDETDNPELARELFLRLLPQHASVFAPLLNDQRQVRFPVSTRAARKCLLREQLTRDFKEEITVRKRRSGEIAERWKDTSVVYSPFWTSADLDEVQKRVDKVIASGDQLPQLSRHLDIEEIERRLTQVDAALGEDAIIDTTPSYFQAADAVLHGFPIEVDALLQQVAALFEAFLRNYRHLVERNFPTLKSQFALFSLPAITIHLVIERASTEARIFGEVPIKVYFSCRSCDADEIHIAQEVEWRRKHDGVDVVANGVVHKLLFLRRTSIRNVFATNREISQGQFREMSLRSLVYARIAEELKDLDLSVVE